MICRIELLTLSEEVCICDTHSCGTQNRFFGLKKAPSLRELAKSLILTEGVNFDRYAVQALPSSATGSGNLSYQLTADTSAELHCLRLEIYLKQKNSKDIMKMSF